MNIRTFSSTVLVGEDMNSQRSDKSDIQCFIGDLLRLNPKERLGALDWNQLKDHDFFKAADFDWKALKNKRMESPLLPVIDELLIYPSYDPETMGSAWSVDDKDDSVSLEDWSDYND
jgi:hypothetical protein